MTVPILVEPTGGEFAASLVGSPTLRCVRPSRDEAIEELRRELAQRLANQELINIEVQPDGLLAMAGKYKDDPDLSEICEPIYKDRAAQRNP